MPRQQSENDATQHLGSGNSLRVRCKRKGGVSERNKMKGGVIPSPGSHESARRQPRSMTNVETGTVHTRETSHTTQAIHGHCLGVIPSERSFSKRFEVIE